MSHGRGLKLGLGIDIREGLQYQCIDCALCIDACNSVMDKMGYQPGLISYTSERQLAGEATHWLRPRLVGYATVLLLMCCVFLWHIFTRVPLQLTAIRDRNQLYVENTAGQLENVYSLQILNMDQVKHSYTVTIEGLENARLIGDNEITLDSGEVLTLPLRVAADQTQFTRPSTEFRFVITASDGSSWQAEAESRFLTPMNP